MTITINYPAILRYRLNITDYQEISTPSSHQILSCAPGRASYDGNDGIDIWIKTSPSDHDTLIGLYVCGTGNPIPDPMIGTLNFIGTCVMPNNLVWHVFRGPLR